LGISTFEQSHPSLNQKLIPHKNFKEKKNGDHLKVPRFIIKKKKKKIEDTNRNAPLTAHKSGNILPKLVSIVKLFAQC
jgi:hypothetical protein